MQNHCLPNIMIFALKFSQLGTLFPSNHLVSTQPDSFT